MTKYVAILYMLATATAVPAPAQHGAPSTNRPRSNAGRVPPSLNASRRVSFIDCPQALNSTKPCKLQHRSENLLTKRATASYPQESSQAERPFDQLVFGSMLSLQGLVLSNQAGRRRRGTVNPLRLLNGQ